MTLLARLNLPTAIVLAALLGFFFGLLWLVRDSLEVRGALASAVVVLLAFAAAQGQKLLAAKDDSKPGP